MISFFFSISNAIPRSRGTNNYPWFEPRKITHFKLDAGLNLQLQAPPKGHRIILEENILLVQGLENQGVIMVNNDEAKR